LSPMPNVRASRGIELPDDVERLLRQLTLDWLALWEVPELGGRVQLEFNRRMTRSIGRCRPDRAEIRLAHWVLDAPRPILREVLCHELAHAACWRSHGPMVRPHGSEWKSLMRRAGFEPRVRLPNELLPESVRDHAHSRLPWEHRCPRCDARRSARRAMPHWRCARCVAAGADGRLQIMRSSGRRDAHSSMLTRHTRPS